MKWPLVLVCTLLTTLWSGANARADYEYVFTNSSGLSTSSFSVAVGQTVTVEVWLAQTGTSTGLTTNGLASGGVQLNTASPSYATVSSASPNTVANGGQFDQGASAAGANAAVTVNQVFSNPVLAATSGTNAGEILLGTFTFTGVSAGSTLTVTADTSNNANELGGGTVITPNGASASITVTAVPEPGPLLLTGLLAVGFAAGFARRRTGAPEVIAAA